MTRRTPFPDPLKLDEGYLRNGNRIFRLEYHYTYISSYGEITVPAGFETDGASVPRLFWPIFPPFGHVFGSAVIHDFLYRLRSRARYDLDRWEADDIFKEAMFNSGIDWLSRETIHRSVRLFGWRSYMKLY
jgi:hypothetical protein